MKKLIDTAFYYVLFGAVGGIFFREFTKGFGFTGVSALSYVHPHLIGLGTFVFLILTLFAYNKDFTGDKKFKSFYLIYNVGLCGMVAMFFVRGILQVLGTELSKGANAAVSGTAGIFHIVLFFGICKMLGIIKSCYICREVIEK